MTPLEAAHHELVSALDLGDARKVQRLCEKYPGVWKRPPGWGQNALSRATDKASWGIDPSKSQSYIECADILIGHGANLGEADKHSTSPLQRILEKGDHQLLRHLMKHDSVREAIRKGVSGNTCLFHVSHPAIWRNQGKNYPLAEVVSALVDAGDTPSANLYSSNHVLPYLVGGLAREANRAPQSGEAAALAILDADQNGVPGLGMIRKAFNAQFRDLFDRCARRYHASQEQGANVERFDDCDYEKAIEGLDAEAIARFESWLIDAKSLDMDSQGTDRRPHSRNRL